MKHQMSEGQMYTFPPGQGDPSSQLQTVVEQLRAMERDYIRDNGKVMGGHGFTAEGCVGHISFMDGSVADIRPHFDPEYRGDVNKMLIRMLYSVFGIEMKTGAVVEDLFEFFVKVFITEVSMLMKKGIRSAYTKVSGNEKVFKGRLLVADNIRENLVHKERVYVEYEIFSPDRAENRVIKSTMEILVKHSKDSNNKKMLKTLLMDFEEIPSSEDVGKDLSTINIDRNMMDYVSPMVWCNIFLNGMGLGNGSSKGVSYALLMDSEEIFRAYVARQSVVNRKDGSYSIRYKTHIQTSDVSGGTAVIVVDPVWNFYDRRNDRFIHDAESLFMTAPGYAVIPRVKDKRISRVRYMAEHYLIKSMYG